MNKYINKKESVLRIKKKNVDKIKDKYVNKKGRKFTIKRTNRYEKLQAIEMNKKERKLI